MGVSQKFSAAVESHKPRYVQKYHPTGQEKELLDYVSDRMSTMKRAREPWDRKWKQWDDNVKAGIPFSNDGKARINLSVEQRLIDLYVGNVQKFQYKVEPEVRCDYRSVLIGKYIMDHFIRKE